MMETALNSVGLRVVMRYETARRAKAMWSEEMDLARAEIVEMLADADEAYFEGHKVVGLSRVRPKRFNSAAFKDDHPGLYHAYLVEPAEDEVRVWVAKKLPNLPGLSVPK